MFLASCSGSPSHIARLTNLARFSEMRASSRPLDFLLFLCFLVALRRRDFRLLLESLPSSSDELSDELVEEEDVDEDEDADEAEPDEEDEAVSGSIDSDSARFLFRSEETTGSLLSLTIRSSGFSSKSTSSSPGRSAPQ